MMDAASESLAESLVGEIESLSRLISSLPDASTATTTSSSTAKGTSTLADEIESLTQIASSLTAKSSSALTEEIAVPPPPPPPLAIEKWKRRWPCKTNKAESGSSKTLGRDRKPSNASSRFRSLERLRVRVSSKSRRSLSESSESESEYSSRRLLSTSSSVTSSNSDVTVIHRIKAKTEKSAEDLLKMFPNFYVSRGDSKKELRASVRKPKSNFRERIREELMLSESRSRTRGAAGKFNFNRKKGKKSIDFEGEIPNILRIGQVRSTLF